MLLTGDDLARANTTYYRLTNEDECHNGFQYRDGLNVDTVPFDPSGTCRPGGLYFFSRVQLGRLIDYIPENFIPYWISEVTFPPDAKIWKMEGKYKADKFILGERQTIFRTDCELLIEFVFKFAVRAEKVDFVKTLLSDRRFSVRDYFEWALHHVSREGCLEMVKLLLADPLINLTLTYPPLMRAAENGHVDVVKVLLADSRINPLSNDGIVLRGAAGNGHVAVVNILISRYNYSTAALNLALEYAAYNGHRDVILRLLADPRTNPTVRENFVLKQVACYGFVDIVKILLADPRVRPTIEALQAAVKYGGLEIVKVLLADSRVDPSANNNRVIFTAVVNNLVDVVKALLADPRVDPTVNDNEPLAFATSEGYYDMIRILLADSRVQECQDGNGRVRHAKHVLRRLEEADVDNVD